MTKLKTYIPLIIGVSVALGIFIGSSLNFKDTPTLFGASSKEAKIKKLIDYIQFDYVDKVDTDSLLDEAITGMLLKLDPHSVYIPKNELKRITENMQGSFVGIGVSFVMHKDSVVVTNVINGGPSEKAGLKSGDRIIIADSDTLFGASIIKKAKVKPFEKGSFVANRKVSDAIMNALKGEPETEVKIKVYRPSAKKIITIPIVRGEVAIKSVTSYFMINKNLGYINIDRFARTTYDEFKLALDDLISQNMTALVLDLRGNPGGFMDVANEIIDEFLPDNKLIVYTKNKKGSVEKSFATSKGDFEKGKVYVLIDQNSASASEIVAGALQDNDKGTIVGRRSFGKGLVQQEMSLGDGSAVRLTTSRYYTPTGRSIQKPYKSDQENYENDYLERIHNGELVSKDSIKLDDELKYRTPKGKIVYGGGGIVPDVFVPIDTLNNFSDTLYGGLNEFVFSYVDNNRAALSKWNVDEFVSKFDLDNKVLNEYKKSLDIRVPIDTKNQENLKMYLNALIARSLFDDLGYMKVTHKKDDMILKVLELEKQN